MRIFGHISIFLLSVTLSGCSKWTGDKLDDDGIVLAAVDGRYLYAAELETVIHPAVNAADSSAMANSYINQWLRDQLLMKEASKILASDLEIEKLVDDYRQRLIKFNFENKIIAERYDTVVTARQIHDFYETNKEQFVLAEPLFRCQYVKIPNRTKRIRTFYRNWRNNRQEDIESFVSEHAVEKMMDSDKWYDWSDIEQLTDKFSLQRAQRIVDQHVTDGEYEYFLKIVEYLEARSISPESYVTNQLVQMILHNRKSEIIEDYKTELYDKAVKNNQIQTR